MSALMGTEVLPEPMVCLGVCLAPLSETLVPYTNQTWVLSPVGFTAPPSVALLVPIAEAKPVSAAGGCPAALVVKGTIEPELVPALFCAYSWK